MMIASHWTRIMWIEIKTLQVLQQAKKVADAWSQHDTTQKKNNQGKLINLNYFYSCYDDWFFDSCHVEVNRWYQSCFVRSQQIFIHSLRLFFHGTSLLLSNLASHASEATTFVIGPEYSTPQRFLAMNDTLILLHQVVSFQLCETYTSTVSLC